MRTRLCLLALVGGLSLAGSADAVVVRNCGGVNVPHTGVFHEVRARNTPCPEARSQVRRVLAGERPAAGWRCNRVKYGPLRCSARAGKRITTNGALDAI
jgi:hypothetical protein